jgi:hypothetical protein
MERGLNHAFGIIRFPTGCRNSLVWSATSGLPTTITIPYGGPPGKVQDLMNNLRKASRINAWAAALTGRRFFCQAMGSVWSIEQREVREKAFWTIISAVMDLQRANSGARQTFSEEWASEVCIHRRAAVIFAALAAHAEVAEPKVITLSCDGTVTDSRPAEPKPEAFSKMGLVVNLTAQTVAGLSGVVVRFDYFDGRWYFIFPQQPKILRLPAPIFKRRHGCTGCAPVWRGRFTLGPPRTLTMRAIAGPTTACAKPGHEGAENFSD